MSKLQAAHLFIDSWLSFSSKFLWGWVGVDGNDNLRKSPYEHRILFVITVILQKRAVLTERRTCSGIQKKKIEVHSNLHWPQIS